MTKITKAVFPVAGLGTRFLPATKAIPKEVLPLVDRPLIQYAIDEAREAGIDEFIFVTARGKSALENYFDSSPELETSLRNAGKSGLLAEVEKTNMGPGQIAYIRQSEPRGLGHAVWCAHRLIMPDEPFAVLLPDDVIQTNGKSCLAQMVDAYEGGSMVATMEVAREQVSAYGVLDVAHGEDAQQSMVKARGLIEKPDPDLAPSNMAVIGRYILAPTIMERLSRQTAGAGNEIQLTDAICAQARSGEAVYGYNFDGQRYDCGSKLGFLQATLAFGLAHEDQALAEGLQEFVNDMGQPSSTPLPLRKSSVA